MKFRVLPLTFLSMALLTTPAHAQLPGVTQDVTARGRMDYAEAVGGPADVYMGTIQIEPGATYGGWHTHPGPVWVVVTSGELSVWGPDGCRTTYPAGAAYLATPDTLYNLSNDGGDPATISFAGVIPAEQPPTVFTNRPPSTSCSA